MHPSNPFCLTQLSIKEIKETVREVLGMMKGQHVGGSSSDKLYKSHWRVSTPTNLETPSDTRGGGGGGGMPGVTPVVEPGSLHIKLSQPLTIEVKRHRPFPNILGYDVPTNRPQAVKQDIRVHLPRTRGGGGGNMQKTSPILAFQALNRRHGPRTK